MVRALLIFGSILVALLAAASSGDLRAGELLANGGFEDGVSHWNVLYGSLDSVASPVEEGQAAARITDTVGPHVRAVQLVDLQPGGTYRLSGYAFVDDPGVRELRMEIVWNSGDSELAWVNGMTVGYQELSVTATLPCNAFNTQVALMLRRQTTADSAYGYVDGLRVESVAPPQPCPTPTSPPVPTVPPPLPSPTSPGEPSRPDRPGQAATPDTPDAVATPPPSGPSGSLVNGGFESAQDGVPTGWRSYGGVLARVAHPVHGGSFAAGFSSATDSTKWVYQTLSVTGAEWYELAAYIHMNDPRVKAALLRISWYASADGTGQAVATVDSTASLEDPEDKYRHLTTGPVQAPAGVHSAKVRILLRPHSAAGAVIYIDDVSFSRTAPAPPSEESDGASGTGSGGNSSGRASRGTPSSRGLGVSAYPGVTPPPTPVIVRRSELLASSDEPAASDGFPWWPVALAAGLAMAGAAGVGAWWWRKRRAS